LFQVVFHARMAEELGAFAFADVVRNLSDKMVRRHPHVFGDEKARSAKLAKGFWEEIKAREKHPDSGVLDGVPIAFPALTRALKLQAKAAKVGFDWPSVENVYDKIGEEIAEFREAPPGEKQVEYGDLLFAIANVARHMGIDPEAALREANTKFERRFRHIEETLGKRGKKPAQSNLEEMDRLWNEAKAKGL
jgi:MazG family protein